MAPAPDAGTDCWLLGAGKRIDPPAHFVYLFAFQ
jgi:hypothetical protein